VTTASVVPKATRRGRPPHRLASLWRTTIGKKYVVAVTGVIMAVWVLLHMLGNLKAIEGNGSASHGQAAIDVYARFLRTAGGPVLPHDMLLWIVRGILIASVVLHITAITQLWIRNRRSKPRQLRAQKVRSTWSARTMYLTGPLILAFVIFHILHFTTLTVHPSAMHAGRVYSNLYGAFHLWWLVVIYVVAVSLLGFHINHGLWSGAQTAGVDNPDRNWFWRRLASVFTVVTVAGFITIPLVFAFGGLPRPLAGNQHAARATGYAAVMRP
jgi:succinate dehydrogenase / fumarate reductase cytochrome b subunit